MPESEPAQTTRKSAAGTVASGIFSSRVMGLVREGTVAYFFGVGAHSDVFTAAFKGPNLLQNLLGEGTISAAFIPIYSRMLAEGRREEAGRFAGAIFGLLLVAACGFVLLGMLLAEPIVMLLTPGYVDDAARVAAGELPINRFALLVQAVQIIFPMTGILVLSAWALGILNSHRRFFLPYFAPVLWNTAIIGALFGAGYFVVGEPLGLTPPEAMSAGTLNQLLFAAFFGALIGGALQFLVQLPLVLRVLTGFRFSLSTQVAGVREALRAFGPVVAGRGVYQLSAYLDTVLASLLAAGALASLRPAQMLYVLPVSLFGLSVAASELPELSRIQGDEAGPFLRRLVRSMRQTLFLTIPAMVGYLGFGYLIVGTLFQRGQFGLNDTWLVYLVLGGYTLGLLATTISRLLQNAFYALGDTKTPARIAVVRVGISTVVAVPLMLWLNQFSVTEVLGLAGAEGNVLYLGAVGLAVGSAAGAWVELWRLLAALRRKLTPPVPVPWGRMAGMTALALAAAVPAGLLWWSLPAWPLALTTALVLGAYSVAYLATAQLAGFSEAQAWTGHLSDRFTR